MWKLERQKLFFLCALIVPAACDQFSPFSHTWASSWDWEQTGATVTETSPGETPGPPRLWWLTAARQHDEWFAHRWLVMMHHYKLLDKHTALLWTSLNQNWFMTTLKQRWISALSARSPRGRQSVSELRSRSVSLSCSTSWSPVWNQTTIKSNGAAECLLLD